MKDKIVLHGSYYGDNFGDRLFVEMFVRWLASIEGIKKENIILPFANSRIRDSVHCSENKGILSILRAKCFVYVGGGYFGEFDNSLVWNLRLIIRHILLAIFAIVTSKPLIIIGVGAGPLSNLFTRKLVVYICNNSRKTIVRDQESYNYLIEYGVNKEKLKLSVDSVLALENRVESKESDHIKVGVHIAYPYENENIVKIVKDIKKFTETIENFKIYYFKDFYKIGFSDYAETILKQYFKNEDLVKVEYQNPDQLIKDIGQFDLLFTVKLHVGIVALTQGVYPVSIAVHQKTKRLYKQLGLEELTTSFENYQAGKIVEIASKFSTSKVKIPDTITEYAFRNKYDLEQFVKEYYLGT